MIPSDLNPIIVYCFLSDVHDVLVILLGAAAARDAKAAPKAKVASKAPTRAGCEKLLQAALALRNSKSLRLALARASLAPPGLAAKASGLLARLEQAEQLALERLSGAERREEAPWRRVRRVVERWRSACEGSCVWTSIAPSPRTEPSAAV